MFRLGQLLGTAKRWMKADPSLSLEHQFFRTICVMASIVCWFVVIPINLFQNLSPWVDRGVFAFGLLSLLAGWWAAHGRYLEKTYTIALVVLLDLLWFPNAGTYGSIGLYYFPTALLVIVLYRGATRVVGLVLLVIDIMAMHIAEQFAPQWLCQFERPLDRVIDLTIGYAISLGTCALILWVVLSGLHKERVKVELNLRRIAEREAELRAMFDSSQDAICVACAERITTVNPAFVRLFRFENRAEPVGQLVTQFIAPENIEAFQDRARSSLCGQAANTECETTAVTRDGTQFPAEVYFSTYQTDTESYLAISVRDVTERRRLQNEQRQLDAQAQRNERMESLGALAGGVAHDMNNVLGAVMALASVHLQDCAPESTLHNDLETVVKACQRGATMVKGLLGFARENLPDRAELNLNAVVREAMTLLERTTLQRVRLNVDLDPGLMNVLGDAAALSHALMNLCVNALDAMPDGGTLAVRTRNQGGNGVVLEVVDTGCGMSREVLDKALDPFFTTKPQGKGTGLGLPIVFGAVKAHRGSMELTSEPGKGTTVRLVLPAQPSGETRVQADDRPAANLTARTLNVLLVDDDELVQHAIHRLLRLLGHTVTTASGGAAAVAVVVAGLRPDLVVLDMNMPELDGAATLPQLREIIPNVPVVLTTGRADQTALDVVANHPLVTMLPKPFDAGDLNQKVESLARRSGI
jgi:PAS domain S-box-containing protein